MILHLCDFDQYIYQTCFDKMSFRQFRFGCTATTKYIHVDTLLKMIQIVRNCTSIAKGIISSKPF